jgi:hypothetical protein
MIEADSFVIERHGLRINMPISVSDGTAKMDCQIPGRGSRFGRIDFSKGFSQWWYLSHIDIHTPSEHTQEGKRYDAELQLHHFYSVSADVAGVANEVATVGIFMQAYDNAPPYRYLDKILCLWRRKEYETRMACGLDPVPVSYPGCFPYHQGRHLRKSSKTNTAETKQYSNVMDLILAHREHEMDLAAGFNVSHNVPPRLHMGPENWAPSEMDEDQWAEFIARESAKFQADEDLWQLLHQEFKNHTDQVHEEYHARHRHLMGGDEIVWFNYWPMLGVRTEYYYRYSGSQTIPPCYGEFDPSSRSGTNHWRMMKDPIRIHPRQLEEMKRLIRERIAPPDDPIMACQPDTAAKIEGNDVNTARPLQYEDDVHFTVFCECKDWPSKWPEDRAWCRTEDPNVRFYDTPYNFRSNGF